MTNNFSGSRIITCIFLLNMFFVFSGCSYFQSDEKKAEKFYKSGLKAAESKKTEEAMIQFKNAIQKNPTFAKAHLQLGTLYEETNQLYLAVREYGIAYSQDTSLNEAGKKLAMLFYNNRSYAQAIPLLKELSAKKIKDMDIDIALGTAYMNTGEIPDSAKVLEDAIKTYGGNYKIKISLAQAKLFNSQPEIARRLMEEAAQEKPDDLTIQMLLSLFYEKTGEFGLAETTLNNITEKFSGNARAYIAKARFLLHRDRLTDAEASIVTSLNTGLHDPTLFHAMALIQHKQKKYDNALKYFKKAAEQPENKQKSLILLGDYYVFLKNYGEARNTYASIAEKWPQLLPVKSKIAELFLAERGYDQALAHVENILEENPGYAKGYLLKGIIWMKEGETSKARESFSKARDLDPGSPEGHYFYGLSFLDDKQYQMALPEIIEALEKKPDSVRIRLARAYIYYKTGKPSSALEDLDWVLNTDPQNHRARVLRSEVYLGMANYEAALNDYKIILDKNPDSPPFQFRLAQIYMAQKEYDKALKGLLDVLNSYPEAIAPIAEIVKIYVSKGEYDKALDFCDEQIRKWPKQMLIGLIKAKIFIKQKKFKNAEDQIQALIKEHPLSFRPLVLLATVHMIQDNYDKALEDFNKVLELNPGNIEAHMNMAQIYQMQGNFDKAIASYESLLSINDSFAPAMNDLAYMYAEKNQNLDRALELASKVSKLLPESPEVMDTMGFIHLKKGSILMARNNFKRAIDIVPQNPAFHFHLGLTYFMEKQFQDASSELKESIKYGLDKSDLAYARDILKEMNDPLYHYADMKKELDKAIRDGDYDKAINLAEQAKKLMPDNHNLLGTIGLIYLNKGSLVLARKNFSEAAELMPENPVPYYYLGLVYHKEKNYSDAKHALEQAIKLGLKSKELISAKNILDELKDNSL